MLTIPTFDWFHFSESDIEIDLLQANEVRLIARNMEVVNVEQHSTVGHYDQLTLVFNDVTKSIRHLHPYAGNPKTDGFLAPIEIIDFNSEIINKHQFELEGVLLEPLSWIGEWIICCDRLSVYAEKVCIFKQD